MGKTNLLTKENNLSKCSRIKFPFVSCNFSFCKEKKHNNIPLRYALFGVEDPLGAEQICLNY